MRMCAFILGGIVLLQATASFAYGQDDTDVQKRQVPLAIVRISDYLNNLRRFTARFVQITEKGGYARGRLYVQRPGKMRVEYDPPHRLEIIADGDNVIIYDPSFHSINSMPLEEFPAGVLLEGSVRLDGERFQFTSLEKQQRTLAVTVRDTQLAGHADVQLFFRDNPLQLERWSIKDSRGETITVFLQDLRPVARLEPSLFVFEPPKQRQYQPFR